MQVHKPDMDFIKDEQERMQKEAKSRKSFTKVELWKPEEGDNIIRAMPPYNARGVIFKKTTTHFDLYPDRDVRSCLYSWPDLFDECYICNVIEKLLKDYPGIVDLGRQQRKDSYKANIIDRKNEDDCVQVTSFTPVGYHWFLDQMGDKRIGDITDIDEGVDIKLNKKITKGKKGGTFTKYTFDLYPASKKQMCSKLHEDSDIVDVWLELLYSEDHDLDAIFSPPNDEFLADIQDVSERMEEYYVTKFSNKKSSSGRSSNDDTRSKLEEKLKNKRSSKRYGDGDNEPEKREEKKEKKKTETVVKPDDTSKDYSSYPTCYIGRDDVESHSDGSVGYSDDLDKCILCEHDIECQEAKKKMGL